MGWGRSSQSVNPHLGASGRDTHALEQRSLDSLFLVDRVAEGARPPLLCSHPQKIPVSEGPATLSPPHPKLPLLSLQRTQCRASSLWDRVEFQTLGRELRQEMLFWSPVPRARVARDASAGLRMLSHKGPSTGRGWEQHLSPAPTDLWNKGK